MHHSKTTRQLAQRLLQTIDRSSSLGCSQARPQIPLLAEAEAAGADADRLPEFAALLQHFDQCPVCLQRYLWHSEQGRPRC